MSAIDTTTRQVIQAADAWERASGRPRADQLKAIDNLAFAIRELRKLYKEQVPLMSLVEPK